MHHTTRTKPWVRVRFAPWNISDRAPVAIVRWIVELRTANGTLARPLAGLELLLLAVPGSTLLYLCRCLCRLRVQQPLVVAVTPSFIALKLRHQAFAAADRWAVARVTSVRNSEQMGTPGTGAQAWHQAIIIVRTYASASETSDACTAPPPCALPTSAPDDATRVAPVECCVWKYATLGLPSDRTGDSRAGGSLKDCVINGLARRAGGLPPR